MATYPLGTHVVLTFALKDDQSNAVSGATVQGYILDGKGENAPGMSGAVSGADQGGGNYELTFPPVTADPGSWLTVRISSTYAGKTSTEQKQLIGQYQTW